MLRAVRKNFILGLVGLCFLLFLPMQIASGSELSDLQDKKEKVEDKLKKLEDEKDSTMDRVKEIDNMLKENQQEINNINAQLTAKEADITRTEKELEEAKAKEKVQYKAMKLRIKHIYESGRIDYIGMLLQSETLGDVLSRSEYVKQVADYDKNLIKSLRDLRDEIAVKELKLKTELKNIEKLKAEAEVEKENNQKMLTARANQLKNVTNSIEESNKQLEDYNKAIAAEEAEIARREREAEAAAEAARKKAQESGQGGQDVVKYDGGALLWPLPGHSRISSYFGAREQPVPGASTNHKGIDIPAPVGTSIVAAEGGTVSISQYSSSAGNYIMISHGGGLSTVYMHCSQLLVGVGATVTRGQVIAKVGNTGYSSGAHLHFGVRVNGTYTNPLQYLQ